MPIKRRKMSKKRTSSGGMLSRKKVCRLCTRRVDNIDYKDSKLLRMFMADSGKILSRKITGTCQKHQRHVAKAIKRARNAGLLPFIVG